MNSKTIGIFMIFGIMTLYPQWVFSSGLCGRAFQKIWKNKPTISRTEMKSSEAKNPAIKEKITAVREMLTDYRIALGTYHRYQPYLSKNIIWDYDEFGPLYHTGFAERLLSVILELKNSGINISQFQQLFLEDLESSYVEEKKHLPHRLMSSTNNRR